MNEATRAQIAAADPARSTWVSANAGSGKTSVLTDRVVRLLLGGTAPGRILCLTYTKAAAAEMQNRLFKRLGAWAMMPDRDLEAALAALGAVDPGAVDARFLAQARRLFANALETPGGLKIQTIHAFCDTLLRRFPVEAGVSPQFEVLDDREAALMRGVILNTMAEEERELFDDLAFFVTGDVDTLLAEIATKRDVLSIAAVEQAFGADETLDPRQELKKVLGPLALSDVVAAAQEGLADTPSNTMEIACKQLLTVAGERDPQNVIDGLAQVFLTQSGQARKSLPIAKKPLLQRLPGVFEPLEAMTHRLVEHRTRRANARAVTKARRLVRFAEDFLARYDDAKLASGRLNFDDLIARANGLLQGSESAQWVLYRLDGGIDHILVDEAQDTSPSQWRIVARLAEEFTAGQGGRDVARTLFVVGDEKQSIYSFQGADPAEFSRMQAQFAAQLAQSDGGLRESALLYSFRSSAVVLDAVDAVFDGSAGAGFADKSTHKAFHGNRSGRVELWPFREAEEKPEPRAWDDPKDMPAPTDPQVTLARDLAKWVNELLASGVCLPGKEEPIRPSDILILVQKRGPIFHHLNRELKARQVPVAGADRLRIAEELAVKDLVSALRFADLPEDDLALAEVMRSPLLGFSEAELFDFAHGRKGKLWPVIRSSGDPRAEILRDLTKQADFLRPYEMLERLLGHHGGRARLLGRLGEDCEEAIDEFLSQALRYETLSVPTLSGFLNWFRAEDVDIKRQMEAGRDLVRVMTVHGAKGLEAPIVILPQCGDVAVRDTDTAILPIAEGGFVWKDAVLPTAAQLAAQETRKAFSKAERMRLLYVAMTRAEQWLIVAGAGKQGDDCWYSHIADGLLRMDTPPATEDLAGVGTIQRVQSPEWALNPGTAFGGGDTALPILPAWLDSPVAPAVPPSRHQSPSRLPGPKALPGGDGLPEEEALRRGRQVHLLLEHLPGTPDRAGLATRLLVDDLLATADERAALLVEAARIIDDPAFAWLFAPGVLAEVGVTGDVPGVGPMEGVIDRLVIGPDRVLVVDFKTNARVPATVPEVPLGILRQMAAYRVMVSALFPDQEVEIAVLWTATGTLMSIPHDAVNGVLDRMGDP